MNPSLNSGSVVNVRNQLVPEDTPRSLVLVLDFSAQAAYDITLLLEQQQRRIGQIQTAYIDLSDTDSTLSIAQKNGTGQVVTAKGRTQGFYNLLCQNPSAMVISSASGIVLTVQLLNVPIPGAVWATQ